MDVNSNALKQKLFDLKNFLEQYFVLEGNLDFPEQLYTYYFIMLLCYNDILDIMLLWHASH